MSVPGSSAATPAPGATPASPALDGAVFVDDTGRRARRWAVVAAALSLVLSAFVLVLAVSVLTPGAGPELHLPSTAPMAAPAGSGSP